MRKRQSRKQRTDTKAKRAYHTDSALPNPDTQQSAAPVDEIRYLASNAPQLLRVEMTDEHVIIRRSMQNSQGCTTVLFNLALLGIIVFFASTWWSNIAETGKIEDAYYMLYALIPIMSIVYYALIVILDDQIIKIDPQQVKIYYRPLPYFSRRIDSGNIQQVKIEAYTRPQLVTIQSRQKEYETAHGICVRNKEGNIVSLIGGIDSHDEAQFIAEIISKCFGVTYAQQT